MNETSPHVKLAMAAIQAYVSERRMISVPSDTPEDMLNKCAGAFVCLKIDGQLRGCIGTIEPVRANLAEEIICNAISAATSDPRFFPVEVEELECLQCSVDVLAPPEEVSGLDDLDPKRYGVIVESEMSRGLLLPDLEGIDTAEQQVAIARQKAFINSRAPIKLYRFEVIRYE